MYILIRTGDGCHHVVRRDLMYISKLIQGLIDDLNYDAIIGDMFSDFQPTHEDDVPEFPDDVGDHCIIPLDNIDSEGLQLVLEFIKIHYKEDRLRECLTVDTDDYCEPWNEGEKFFEKIYPGRSLYGPGEHDKNPMVKVINASHFLHIPMLTRQAMFVIGRSLRGKNKEQMAETLGMSLDEFDEEAKRMISNEERYILDTSS